ncbi:MAG: transcription termination factor Rho [Solirubrobacteraceae bacterium]|jgi:transcription termination factor Rho|nr:transcription termination factor Rho [Solirubrobacteraceae bacterium]
MSTVLDRDALEGSPLADLHLIAGQLGLDGFRRLRKADLVDAIVAKQSGEEPVAADDAPDDDEAPTPRRRRSRAKKTEETDAAVAAGDQADAEEPEEPRRGRGRGRRGGGGGSDAPQEDKSIEGIVELQNNGSGFVRLNHPETSDDDVYVSAAQVKRCELVSGDKVGGPVRPPRRSERFPSLVRVETINGRPAEEVAGKGEATRFDDHPSAFPTERWELGSEDPTVTAVEWLIPFGKGSRVAVCGPTLAGKSDLLRRIAGALAGREGIELTVVLAGARPEEVGEWGEGIAPETAATLGSSADQQAQAVEQAVEVGRRVAARGGDAVVVIDALDQIDAGAARKALAAARNIVDGGSLTVIAAVAAPLGGETTVITLDAELTGLRRFPNVDLGASATMRPELLVGDAGAEKIATARSEALAAG